MSTNPKSSAPKKLNPAVVSKLVFLAESKTPITGVLGGPPYVQRGQIRTALDGQRLVLHAGGEGVYYLLVSGGNKSDVGYVFFQDADHFCKDVRDYVFARAGKGALGMAYVAETSIEFLMGVASSASGVAMIALLTLDIAKLIHEHEAVIRKVGRLAVAWAKASGVLRAFCPTLHAKLELALWRGAKEMLPALGVTAAQTAAQIHKLPTAKDYARIAGAVVGIFGGKVGLLKQSSLARGVFDVLKTIVKTAALSMLKGAPKVAISDPVALEELIIRLRSASVEVSHHEGRAIAAEVGRFAKQLQPVLDDVVLALKDLTG